MCRAPPVSLRCVKVPDAKLPRIVAGCEDGTVAVLNQMGTVIRLGKVTGRPTHMEVLQMPTAPIAVLATDQGEIKAFQIPVHDRKDQP